MTLTPDAEKPGLWIDPRWRPGMPGTFAVIIGVSRYEHLRRDSESYDLGQLYVSAFTAYHFFRWLTDDYRYYAPECPVVHCWLLLSPTADETAAMPGIGTHALAPAFANCEHAIGSWYEVMKHQGRAARDSRSFFFFSGHGLEVHSSHQVLLPSDYLAGPARTTDRAISTNNLLRGLLINPVPTHLLFVDACRDDHEALRQQDVRGTNILNVGGAPRNPDANIPILRATSSGNRAWQPEHPRSGLTVFGQALLDGLRAEPGFQPDCTADACDVRLRLLESFANARVVEILRSYRTEVRAPVRVGGDSADLTITRLPLSAARGTGTKGAREAMPVRGVDVPDVRHTVQAPQGWHPSEGDVATAQAGSGRSTRAGRIGLASPHDFFGSERQEELWTHARVYSFARHRWLPRQVIRLLDVERDQDAAFSRITFRLDSTDSAHWLVLPQPWFEREGQSPRGFGCALPGEPGRRMSYDIAMRLERSAEGEAAIPSPLPLERDSRVRWLSQVAVMPAVSSETSSQLDQVWRAFLAYPNQGPRAVHALLESTRLPLDISSPLAAALLGVLILELGDADLQKSVFGQLDGGWPQQLVSDHHWLPDGGVLLAEQRLIMDDGPPTAAVEALLTLRERGLPMLTDLFARAVRRVEDFLQDDRITGTQRELLEDLQRTQRAALRAYRSAGIFTTFADTEFVNFIYPAVEPTPQPAFQA